MKTILTSFLVIVCISMFGAVPNISYSGGAQVYKAGIAITALTPTNTGDPVTTPATVTTFVAAAGGQPHGMAFNSDYSLMYTGLKNVFRVGKVTMSAGTSAIFAGNATGFNDATGTSALFAAPYGTAVHPITGDIYVADQTNNRIRKITTAGVVTTFAGNGTGANVDGAIASSQFNGPVGLAFDTDGTLYVLTYGSSAIRKISSDGTTVSTIISGIGTTTYHFAYKNGYFYVSDIGTSTNKIYKISLALGTKTTLAGSGVASSLDGTGTAATFNGPRGLAVDDYGFVYVNEYSANKIRRIDPNGVVTTFAGSGTNATTNGVGTAAAFRSNAGLIFDNAGNLYVGDAGGSSIRKVTVNPYSISPTLPAGLIFDGTTGTISGTPTANSTATDYTITATNTSGSATTIVNIATIYTPNISYTGSPLTYTVNSAITPLIPTNTGGAVPATAYGTVTTAVASAGGQPHGMAFNSDYSLMYTGLKSVWRLGKVTMSAGTSATLAGTGATGTVDATGTSASFGTPYGVAVHPTTGDIYVADQGNNTIRKITIGGVVTTYAGIAGTATSLDGAIASATFSGPACLAFDTDGSLYVLQSGSSKIRKINAAGTTVSTIASSIGTFTYHFAYSNGYFYVSDTGAPSNIYKVALADGTKTTLAGSGTAGYSDGTGTGASFSGPRGIVVDGSGNVYVNDYGNHRIRMITPAGVVTTVAGNGTNTSTDGLGVAATFASPAGLIMDNTGNLYVGDAGTSKIRKVVVTGYTISPSLPAGLSFDVTTGIISGTPTVNSASTDYTITAFNGGGSSSATVNITIGTGNGLYANKFNNSLLAYAVGNVEIRLVGAVSKNAVATLFDIRGSIIQTKNLTEGNLNIIPTTNIKSGLYLLSVKNNDKLEQIKVLVK
jgi:mucin-19